MNVTARNSWGLLSFISFTFRSPTMFSHRRPKKDHLVALAGERKSNHYEIYPEPFP